MQALYSILENCKANICLIKQFSTLLDVEENMHSISCYNKRKILLRWQWCCIRWLRPLPKTNRACSLCRWKVPAGGDCVAINWWSEDEDFSEIFVGGFSPPLTRRGIPPKRFHASFEKICLLFFRRIISFFFPQLRLKE